MDFGNFEVVPLESLYEIPFKYVIPKVMALRFALASIEKSEVTLEMQCAFKKFVDNRLVQIKVMPTGVRTALPRCELWDPETNINALDVVKQAATNLYPEPIVLNRGINIPVRVSYVFSCSRFYVQIRSKEDELRTLMEEIQAICQQNKFISVDAIKVGLPCYAMFIIDQQWYRCKIIEQMTDGNVKILYIDYGNEDIMSPALLKVIDGAQLTALRPQAIECCLNGYQNMDSDLERDNILEELIMDNEFTMKVIEMQQNNRALVELINNDSYNMASLLLNKIAERSKAMISPLLVQEGSRLEHRKTSYPKVHPSTHEESRFSR